MKLSDFIKKYGDCEVSEEMEKMIQKPKGKWMPKECERYYFVHSSGEVKYADYWNDCGYDEYRIRHLRVFKTQQEAERYLEIQKAFKEASFEPDWNKHGQGHEKWTFNVVNDRTTGYVLCVNTVETIYSSSQFFFNSAYATYVLTEKFGEKDILKYIFGIEEDE